VAFRGNRAERHVRLAGSAFESHKEAAMPTRAEAIANTLQEFLRSAVDVEGAAVVSPDGLPMASALPQSLDEERLSAMTAAMLSLGERAAEALGRGRLNQVFVEGSNGYVFLMSAGPAVLCAITRHGAKIGLVLYEMRRASAGIAASLEEPAGSPTPSSQPAQLRPQREQSAS
jgi:predicted regulator of Ras-like GTPase activity (Roadblock/LC7/MglB family)